MDNKFIAIVQQVVSEKGKTIVNNRAVFNSLLADYAKGKFMQDRRLFMQELKTADYDRLIKKYQPSAPVQQNNLVQANAFRKTGNANFKSGNYGGAIAEYTKGIQMDSKDAELYLRRATAHQKEGAYSKALSDINTAIQLNPKQNPEMYFYLRGSIHENQKERDLAIADYSKAIQKKDTIWQFYGARGNAYAWQGEFDEAIADLENAVSLMDSSENGKQIKEFRGYIRSLKESKEAKNAPAPAYDEADYDFHYNEGYGASSYQPPARSQQPVQSYQPASSSSQSDDMLGLAIAGAVGLGVGALLGGLFS